MAIPAYAKGPEALGLRGIGRAIRLNHLHVNAGAPKTAVSAKKIKETSRRFKERDEHIGMAMHWEDEVFGFQAKVMIVGR